jgi:hypothetical protein
MNGYQDEARHWERECDRLRADNAALSEKVRQLTKLLDDQVGTPCEQIRNAQEALEAATKFQAAMDQVEELVAALKDMIEITEDIPHYADRARAAIAKARGGVVSKPRMTNIERLEAINGAMLAAKVLEIERLRAINAELVEALRKIEEWGRIQAIGWPQAVARAALAKAKGEV